MNKDIARGFLEALFSDHLVKYGGYIEILHKRINQNFPDSPLYFNSISGLLDKFDSFTGNTWFGVAPRETERANKKAINYISCLWTELDIGVEGHKDPGEFNTKEDAFEFINKFELKPSIIVESGQRITSLLVIERFFQ